MTLLFKKINTVHGSIHGRDAMIVKQVNLELCPTELSIEVSLSLRHCFPEQISDDDLTVTFKFHEIKKLYISMSDDYEYSKDMESCFDEIIGNFNNGLKRYVLKTYDHTFDIVGKYKLI